MITILNESLISDLLFFYNNLRLYGRMFGVTMFKNNRILNI